MDLEHALPPIAPRELAGSNVAVAVVRSRSPDSRHEESFAMVAFLEV